MLFRSLLQQALSKVAQLPATEQDALAAIVMKEIESEQRWTTSFHASQDILARLSGEALAEHQSGKTKPFPQ